MKTISINHAKTKQIDKHILNENIIFAITLTLLALCWTAWAGKDISWDVINHHLYLPYSFITGRFQLDLYAAGPQSYQNPLGYLPFYLLVQANVPAWLIGSILAVLHSAAAWAIYALAREIWGPAASSTFWRTAACASACVTPVFLISLGTSSIDVITNVMVLWGLWSILHAPAQTNTYIRTNRLLLVAGALLGLAFATKPSNAIFVLSAGLITLLQLVCNQISIRQFITFASTAACVALLGMGIWSWWLWSTFGNPLFPLFNQYFNSPFAPTEPVVSIRFLPNSIWSYVLRPWEMIKFQRYVTTEAFTPDIRPLAAVISVVASALLITWRTPGRWIRREIWVKSDAQLIIFSCASYIIWLTISGNARYAIPLFMVCGVVFVRLCQKVFPRRAAIPIITAIISTQAVYYIKDGEHRFVSTSWDAGKYIDVNVPNRLKDQPFLHISIGVLSYAGIAPYLHPNGNFINAIGQISLPVSGALGQAFQQRLRIWQGRTRVLFNSPQPRDLAERKKVEQRTDSMIYRLGLQIDWSDCEEVIINLTNSKTSTPSVSQHSITADPHIRVLSCLAVPLAKTDPQVERQQLIAERVFAIVEASCQKLFRPIPFVSDRVFESWQRLYINSDSRILVSLKDGVFISHFRAIDPIYIGSVDDVLLGQKNIPCTRWSLSTPE